MAGSSAAPSPARRRHNAHPTRSSQGMRRTGSSTRTRSEATVTQNAVPLTNAHALAEIWNAGNWQIMNAPPTTMEVTRLQGRIHEVGRQLTDATNDKEQLERQLTVATNDKEQLERQLTVADKKNKGHEEYIRTGTQLYLRACASNKALKKALDQLKNAHNAVKSENNKALKMLDQLKNAHNALKNENNKALKMLVQLNNAHNALKNAHNAVKSENNALGQLKNEHDALDKKHNALKRKRTETKTKLTETKTKLTDTETKLTTAETKLTTAVEQNHDLMKIVADFNRERKELKDASVVDNERINVQTRRINELEREATNRDRRIAQLEKEGFDRERYIAERENIHAEFMAEETPSNF